MKKNYVVIIPMKDENMIKKNGEFLCTPKIEAIYNDIIDGEIYDHIFYIDNVDDLLDYDNLNEVSFLLYDMMQIYFENAENTDIINSANIIFKSTVTDEVLFRIFAKEINGDVEFSVFVNDVVDDDDDDDVEMECDGDCDNCPIKNNDSYIDENGKASISSFYFGIDW